MSRVPISPRGGIYSDDTGFATPSVWRGGNNARPYRGKMQSIGGCTRVFKSSVSLTGVCRNALAWVDLASYENVAFGTHSALQVYKLGVLSDITPVGLVPAGIDGAGGPGYGAGEYGDDAYGSSDLTGWYAGTWSLQNFGEWLLANPRGGTLYKWANDPEAPAEVVEAAPAQINCILTTLERQVLAGGCTNKDGDFDPMLIRGCDLENIDNWTIASDNNAFQYKLEGGSRIVGMRLLGTYVAVWTDTCAFLGTFIGDSGQAYRFDLISENCGLAGPNAAAVFNQVAHWITPDLQVYAWPLGLAPPAPMACTVHSEFRDNVVRAQMEKIVATTVSEFSEVWIFYPDARDGHENSRYIAYSTQEQAWFLGDVARTAAIDSGATRWPLYVAYDGSPFWHENGHTDNGGPLHSSITLSDTYLGEAEQHMYVRGIWPDFEGQIGPLTLTMAFKKFPQSPPRTRGPWVLEPGREKKDFMAEGRLGSFTLEANSAPSFWRMGKLSFDVVPSGGE